MSLAGRSSFQYSYQVSPIILTDGAAANIPGGMLPIISILQSGDFNTGLLSGSGELALDDFFAQFVPLSNSTLVDQDIATYPFANQTTAANAVIAKPLAISLRMICPVREPGGYTAKLQTITALKQQLEQHNLLGGTYTVATPSFIWTGCLLSRLFDATEGGTNQAQVTWQWDFVQPLLTEQQAILAMNSLMKKINSGTRFDGEPTWSGIEPTVGNPPSLAGLSIIPAAQGPAGSGVSSAAGGPQSFLPSANTLSGVTGNILNQ